MIKRRKPKQKQTDALTRAAEAARKVLAKHGYDLSTEAITSSYLATNDGSSEPNRELPASPQAAGGAARAAKLSPSRRSAIAAAAAAKRWAKKEGKKS